MKKLFISLDQFCYRQFDKTFLGPKIEVPKEEFVTKVNEFYETGKYSLVDGYAPFCKHLFIPNFAKCALGVLEITKDNEHLLRSAYYKRAEHELPVLTRWFPSDKVEKREAKYLDLILYSKEQIELENSKTGVKSIDSDSPWSIVSVKFQDEDYETPMQPITMMRNALGKEYGGSGVSLDLKKYQESVDYWSKHATIS